jgi:hypothetical protein
MYHRQVVSASPVVASVGNKDSLIGHCYIVSTAAPDILDHCRLDLGIGERRLLMLLPEFRPSRLRASTY